MAPATLRFYGELADFLPARRRGVAFEHDVGDRRSVKDLIESLGVPHCEVFVVLADGESVPFDRVVVGGERISVYPHFTGIGAPDMTAAGETWPCDGRLVLDGHLGRLAAYLRALGLDVVCDRDADDAAIARIAAAEDRVVLTRDIGLLKRSLVRRGCFVRATAPLEQLAEVVRRLRLLESIAPFTRCLRCNTRLVEVPRESVGDAVPPGVLERFERFSACPGCGRTFWPGTHHEHLTRVLAPYLGSAIHS